MQTAVETPQRNGISQDPIEPRGTGSPKVLFYFIAVLAVGLLMFTPTAKAAWRDIAQFLSLQGKPEPVSANVLSEHEIETLDQMSPQGQAELLLERSINHFKGANGEIAERVGKCVDRSRSTND